MAMRRLSCWIPVAGAVLLFSGCKSLVGCSDPEKYAGAEDLPRLKIPVGLDGPDTTQALALPELPASSAAAPVNGDSCLEEPPPMLEPGSQSAPVRDVPEPEQEAASRRNRPISPPR
jgi:hypothetical protein